MLSLELRSSSTSIIQSACFYWGPTVCRPQVHLGWVQWTTSLQNATPRFYQIFVHLLYVMYMCDADIVRCKIILMKALNRSSRNTYTWINEQTMLVWLLLALFHSLLRLQGFFAVWGVSGMSGMRQRWRVQFLSDTFLSWPVSWAEWIVAEDGKATYGLRTICDFPPDLWEHISSSPHPNSPVSPMRESVGPGRNFLQIAFNSLYSCLCLNLATREDIKCSIQGIRFKFIFTSFWIT